MSRDVAIPGDFNVICDRSGFKAKASETVIEARTGKRVLKRFADAPNPLDYPDRRRSENTGVRDGRPEAADVFLAPGDVTAASL